MKIEDMVVLLDGTQADHADCARGEDGIVRHKNGVPVAMGEDGQPETIAKRTARNAPAAEAGKRPEAAKAEAHSDDLDEEDAKHEAAVDERVPGQGHVADNPT